MGACGPPGASRCSARASLPTPRGEPRFGVDCAPSRGDPPLGPTAQDRPAKPLMRKLWRKVFQIRLALVDRRKYQQVVLEEVIATPIVVLPDVFNPKLLRSGEFLAQQLGRLPADSRVLDLGSGSGAAGVLAAKRGAHVMAVDINHAAVRCTR